MQANIALQNAADANTEVSDSGRVVFQPLVFVIEALTVGGAEQMLIAMANQLCNDGWPVHLVCLTKPGELAANLDDRISLHVLGKKAGLDISLPWRLRKLVKSIAPAAVNSHLWTANTWTRASLIGVNTRIVATEHSRDTWKSRLYRLIDKVLANRTHSLVAVSSDTADFYINDIGVPAKLVSVINNGINTARFRDADGSAVRQQLLPEGGLLVGTVGRMISAKNHQRLAEAVSRIRHQVPSLRLVYVGDGPERGALEQALEQLGIADITTLTGTRSDVPELLNAFDIFVLSSDREGHPLTALEAQAAGTPVVLTDAGGSSDAIVRAELSTVDGRAPCDAESGGLLVDKSVDALSEGLLRLALDENARADMGMLGRNLCESQFDQHVMVRKYLELFVS